MERKKQTLQIILFFLIGSAILYWVYLKSNAAFLEDCILKGIPLEDCNLLKKVKTDFFNSDKFYVTLCIFLFLVSNIFRTLRWQQLLAPLGKKPDFINAFGSVAIGYITNLTIPRSGEVVRAGILTKYEGIKFENAFGTIVTERIVDLICLVVVIFLGILFAGETILQYFSANFSIEDKVAFFKDHPFIFGAGLLSILGLGIILLYKKDKILKSQYGIKLKNFFKGLFEGIVSIRKLNNPILFALYSIAIWALYYLMTYLMFFALESTSHLDAISGLVVFIFGSLGMVFPSPGGLGSYHFLIEEALKIYGIELADSFSFANIMFFAIQIFGIILFGLLAFLYLPFHNKKRNDN